MESPDYNDIRSWCKSAQEIADEFGVEEALSFLMGEKLAPMLRDLKNARTQVQYLYSEKDRKQVESLAEKDQSFRLGYMMAVENNYKEHLGTIEHLEQVTRDFVQEIKEAFEEKDVLDYLESYPRLQPPESEDEEHFDVESLKVSDFENASSDDIMSSRDLMAEIDDIYLAEEIRKLLQKNWQTL